MAVEIERKFLVLDDRWRRLASKGSALHQAYLVATKGKTVRIRTIDGRRATLTVKIRSSRNRREEYEYDIPYTDAKEMFEHAQGVLQKTRFEVHHQGYTWEVDVYSGQHRGLVVAEVELEGVDDTPPLPDWLGAEVTGNPLYSNRVLAKGRIAPTNATARLRIPRYTCISSTKNSGRKPAKSTFSSLEANQDGAEET
ncbi:CYTH domain-containing protein [Ensifer sp. B1-9]|uniref:CYTH domain-containing protein n=1 Tax=Ensifer sp. B1-9 TaxID=3141455 RepID=UPI003D1F29E9